MIDPVLSSLMRIDRQRLRSLRRSTLDPRQYVGVMHLIVPYLGRHPGASQEDIATFYAVDKAGVARAARRLEELGQIRRELVPDNRRQYQMFLTEAGQEMLSVIDQATERFQQRLAAGISPEDWALLAGLLQRLEANVCCPSPAPCPDPPETPS